MIQVHSVSQWSVAEFIILKNGKENPTEQTAPKLHYALQIALHAYHFNVYRKFRILSLDWSALL